MQRSEQQWQSLQTDLRNLKQQNIFLRQRIQELQKLAQIQSCGLRSTFNASIKRMSQKPSCIHCKSQNIPRSQLLQDLRKWSKDQNKSIYHKINIQQKNPINEQNQNKLIQKICLFGPNLIQIPQIQGKKGSVQHYLYYPRTIDTTFAYEPYGFAIFPQAVGIRAIKQRNKAMQIDKVVFRKNLKNIDCKVIIFQSKQFKISKNNLLKQINPFGIIYCISVEFQDLLTSPRKKQADVSVECKQNQNSMPVLEDKKSEQNEISTFKSNFSLCLFSLYPFVQFFTQILLKMVDIIKINRMNAHTTSPEQNLYSYKFIISQLEQIIPKIYKQTQNLKIQPGLFINLHEQQIVKLSLGELKKQIIRSWAYRILRLLDKDILYQLYILVMMEQSICFVCPNKYILTLIVSLFADILPYPFKYPHNVISNVFQLQYLQTPFISIVGLAKDLKWLQQQPQQFLKSIQGKHFVFVTQQQIKIKCKKKLKLPKSDRLRKIFSNFYKKSQKIDPKCKQILTRQILPTEDDLVLILLNELKQFYQQQMLGYLPNKQIVQSIRIHEQSKSQNLSFISNVLIKQIEEYMKRSRGSMDLDPVVELLQQKQIFFVFITVLYDII